MAQTGLQYPQYYQPNPATPDVIYDAQGNLVTLDQFKAATGQTNVPDNQLNRSFIQQTDVPVASWNSVNPQSITGVAAVWNQLTPADQLFVSSALATVKNQYETGGPASIDQNTWVQALLNLSTDPSIKSQYGDSITLANAAVVNSLNNILGNNATNQALQQAKIQQQRQSLEAQIGQAGGVISGYNKQAQQQEQASEADIIQSTRSQLQQSLQSLGSQYESTYGSTALNQNLPPITATGPLTGPQSYVPAGGIIGTQTQAQVGAETTLAQQQGLLPTVSSTGVVNYGGTK